MQVVFSYVAVKPLRAEHPVGSGTIVEYQPGDMVPANEWGRATDNLVELGKVARLAVNIDEDEDMSGDGQAEAVPSAPVDAEDASPRPRRKKTT